MAENVSVLDIVQPVRTAGETERDTERFPYMKNYPSPPLKKHIKGTGWR